MIGTIRDSETGRVLGTIDLCAPISNYIKECTVNDHYKMCYKRWRMIRRAENLLLPRHFKGFSVKMKMKNMRFAYFSNKNI